MWKISVLQNLSIAVSVMALAYAGCSQRVPLGRQDDASLGGMAPTTASSIESSSATTNVAATSSSEVAPTSSSSALSSTVSTTVTSTTVASSSAGPLNCTPVTWTFTEKWDVPGYSVLRGDIAPDIGVPGIDRLDFSFATDATGVIDLGSAKNVSYDTCEQCVLLRQDMFDTKTGTFFFQISGSLQIDPASTPTNGDDGNIVFTGSDIRLIEYGQDYFGGFLTEPIPGGDCFVLESVSFTDTPEICGNDFNDDKDQTADCDEAGCPFDPSCTPPAGWTCEPFYYNRDNYCDCDCGVVDPDCLPGATVVFNCGHVSIGATCSAEGHCVPPVNWTCDDAGYMDGSICDCNCGAIDPDCEGSTKPVVNCGAGQICGLAGDCENACGNGDEKCDPLPPASSECNLCPELCAEDTICGFCAPSNMICDLGEACTCSDCHAVPFCNDLDNCFNDGFCGHEFEGCACADCAGHPNCTS